MGREEKNKMGESGEGELPVPTPITRRGTVTQNESGRWRVRYRTPDGRRRSATFATQLEAETFRVGCERLYGDSPSLTLEGYGEGWLDRRELSREHRNIHSERSVWKAHVTGTPLALMPMRAATRRDVRTWVEGMRKKKALAPIRGAEARLTNRPLSRSVIRQALVLVRQAFQAALDEDLIEDNPAKDVHPGRRAASTEDGFTFLTLPEIDAVMAVEGMPPVSRALLTVAIYSGLRQGELGGLRWSDVELEGERPQITVRYSFNGPTKNGKVRRVPLLTPALEALQAWKPLCPKHVDDVVFPTVTGERRRKGDDAGWSDQCRRRDPVTGIPTKRVGWKTLAGITRRVRFHDLRHTTASHLVMGSWGRSWTLTEVKDMLGHSTTAVTERYSHLSPGHLHRAAAETPFLTGPGTGAGTGRRGVSLVVPSEVSGLPGDFAARDAGFEPATFGFGDAGGREEFRGSAAHSDPRESREMGFTGDRVHAAAKGLLLLTATGEPVPSEAIEELVNAIFDVPMVALALAAKNRGPLQLMHALRLAAAVCEAFAAHREIREAGKGA